MKKIIFVVLFIFFTSVLFGINQIGFEDAIDDFAKELTSRLNGNETTH